MADELPDVTEETPPGPDPAQIAGDALESASRAVQNAAAVTEQHNMWEDSRWTTLQEQHQRHAERLATLEERVINLDELARTHEHEPALPAEPAPPETPPTMEAPPPPKPQKHGLTRR